MDNQDIFEPDYENYKVKGALCSCAEEIQSKNFKIYIISEVKIQNQIYGLFYNWINKLFSEENKVHRTLPEARKVAGSAKYSQSENGLKLCLQGQCVYSVLVSA